MRYELKNIGIWAFVKIAFFLNMVVGFVFGLFYAVLTIMVFALAASMPFMDMPGIDPEALSPGILLVSFPLMFSFIGAVFVTMFELIVLVLYNLFSRFLGGLEFKLEPIEPATVVQNPTAVSAASVTPPIVPIAPAAPVAPSVAPTLPPPPPTPSETVTLPQNVPVAPDYPAAPDSPAVEPKRADGSPEDAVGKNLPPNAPDAPDAPDAPKP